MIKEIALRLEQKSSPSGAEALPIFLNKYGKDFSFANGFLNHSHVEKKSKHIYIYGYTSLTYWYNAIVDLNLDLKFKDKEHEELFYDINGDFQYDSFIGYGILIKNKGKILGYYDLTYKRLLLSDITHFEDNLKNAYLVLKSITKIFNLKKLWKLTINDVTVGCDPEFVLVDSYGNVVHACDYVDDEYYDNPIGVDGSGDQLELRPSPGSPQQVVNNLKELIAKVHEYDDFDLRLTVDFSLGGHIHIGVGKEIYPSEELLAVLDDFIGKPTRYMCERYGYGALSSFESKDWGFEYRTPSSAIFLKPSIAKIVLKLARNITLKAIKNKVIKYNYPPTSEDYIKVGNLTKREAKELLKFYEKKHYLGYSIVNYWLYNKKEYERKTYPLEIIFKDEWSFYTKNNLQFWAKHIRLKKPITLTLFGLREDRGKVNTIKIPGYEVIEHPNANDYRVGVAWEIRHGANVLKFFKALRLHIRKILKEEN